MNCTVIFVIAIILLVLVFFVCYQCMRPSENKQISPFSNLENYKLAYANTNEPYDKPFVLQHFITPDQCKKIIEYANDKLFDSEVIGGKHKNIRNSQQCWIPKNSPLVKSMFDKVSKMFSIPVDNAEDLQVVRYLPGQYYNEHHDACCDDNDKCLDFVKKGGQRMLTVLIYLNNEFDEGYTYFKNLNLKVKPPTGDAIVFFPLARGTNKCHPLALHAGMPVTKGEKWVANLWFRESTFRP
ncbi:mg709 protein [Tupanvirus deep ocean]|uniref:Mg709 protein n=2 Tax=Tupanvirus TaxID=2094720 RepID=A0AC62A750_9VIRU|nr:mg709 protein [Tupanvirus deep ocean]QKU33602.1 mg709 protein [Tupanvirus deep ocean]